MINAARAAAGVIQVRDSLSGQMKREELLESYANNNGFRHEHRTGRELTKGTVVFDLHKGQK
jgi:hypothetical protein